MKIPRFSLRSLLLFCTAFSVYFAIGRLAPLLAVMIFCVLFVLAAQSAAMGLMQLDSTSGDIALYLFLFVALIACVSFVIGIAALLA